ncbi:MAG: hypothetical protein Kow0070_28490 [Anaerolineales bacterium]
MKGFNSQKGQALILIVFGIVALIGFTALAVDGGRVFSDRRHMQNTADTSAMAAAMKYIRSNNDKTAAQSEALARAQSNFQNRNTVDPNGPDVQIEFCKALSSDNVCTPSTSNDDVQFIRVRITSEVPMTFGRVLGRDMVTNVVEAVARVKGKAGGGPFSTGAGMYSTRRGNYNDCFKVLGSANLAFHDTGIFVNCSGNDALSFGGSANIYMDANAQVVGCSNDLNFKIGGTGKIDCGATEQDVSESTFAGVPTTLPRPTCSTPGSYDSTNNVMYPGAFTNLSLRKNTTLMPGTYCFSGSLNLIAGANISATGPVKLVMSNALDLKGNANNFTDLEIYANNSNFSVSAQGVLNANRMRFFGEGNSSFSVGAQGVLNSGNIYIYSERGQIDIQAGADVDITAPPQGDTFGGLLMYMPWNNPNDFILNGGTGNIWRGTILMPQAQVTYNGSSGFKLYGQVIAETFKINGNTGGDIYYSADYVYSPPPNPTITIEK